MTRYPAVFDGVRCLVAPQPVTPRYIAERRLALLGLGDRRLRLAAEVRRQL